MIDANKTTGDCEARTRDLDFVIVGGGILGTGIAALASQAGYRVLVLRLGDIGVPRADTLRNQGWLQSGLLYPKSRFADESEYRALALRTFFGGRDMLVACGMQLSQDRGVLRVLDATRRADIEQKARLLRRPKDEFRQLEPDEVRNKLQDFEEAGSTYYMIPDTPFDEAAVMSYLRDLAIANGAEFCTINQPATLQPHGASVRICCGSTILQSSLTLVVAGAGSLELMSQVGYPLQAVLRRTPLLVHPGTCDLPASILVELERGFSAVRHVTPSMPKGAVVMGTRVNLEPAPFANADERRIPTDEVKKFEACLHPILASRARTGRFTAGYEVIPEVVVDSCDRLVTWLDHILKDWRLEETATMGLENSEIFWELCATGKSGRHDDQPIRQTLSAIHRARSGPARAPLIEVLDRAKSPVLPAFASAMEIEGRLDIEFQQEARRRALRAAVVAPLLM